jgi:hypothetical protein
VTPTREAVTWGSLLYTFRWLLDRGSCGGSGGWGLGEHSLPCGEPPRGPMVPISSNSASKSAELELSRSSPAPRSWALQPVTEQ